MQIQPLSRASQCCPDLDATWCHNRGAPTLKYWNFLFEQPWTSLNNIHAISIQYPNIQYPNASKYVQMYQWCWIYMDDAMLDSAAASTSPPRLDVSRFTSEEAKERHRSTEFFSFAFHVPTKLHELEHGPVSSRNYHDLPWFTNIYHDLPWSTIASCLEKRSSAVANPMARLFWSILVDFGTDVGHGWLHDLWWKKGTWASAAILPRLLEIWVWSHCIHRYLVIFHIYSYISYAYF